MWWRNCAAWWAVQTAMASAGVRRPVRGHAIRAATRNREDELQFGLLRIAVPTYSATAFREHSQAIRCLRVHPYRSGRTS
jgi:hypothetical protein